MKMSFCSLVVLLSIGSNIIAYRDLDYIMPNNTGGNFTTLRTIGGTVVCLLGLGALSQVEDSGIAKNIADSTSSEPKDISNVLGLSFGFGALSYLLGNDEIWRWACRTPVMAVASLIATSKTTEKILRKMWLIGDRFKCSNEECTGICNMCKITKGVLGIGLYLAVRPGFDVINNYTGLNI